MKRWSAMVCLISGITWAGCASEATIEGLVSAGGVITQNGAPVEGATIVFHAANQGQRAASGTSDAQGRFRLTTLKPGDGAMPGKYNVTVTKVETAGKELSSEEGAEYVKKHGAPPPSASKNVLPEKYARLATSGLTYEVKQGEKNEFEIKLE